MKISYKDLQEAEQSLLRLLQIPMEPKLAYRMTKLARQIHDTFKYINKIRIDLVHKYGEKEKDNDNISVPKEKYPQFKKEFEDFLAKETDMDIQKIPWECIELSGVKLSPIDLVILNSFIVIPDKLKEDLNV